MSVELEDMRARIDELEALVESQQERLACFEAFEDDMRVLHADRQLLLERLNLTEHEWACSGGQRLGDFVPASEYVDDNDEDEDEFEAPTAASPAPAPPAAPPPPPEWLAWPVTWRGTQAELKAEWERRFGFMSDDDVVEQFGDYRRMHQTCALLVTDGECQMLEPLPPPPGTPAVADEFDFRDTLAELLRAKSFFSTPPPRAPEPTINWTEEQRAALDQIDEWYQDERAGSFLALTGAAGTGKSTMMREIARRYMHRSEFDDSPSVALAAMTGKAALRLQQCSGQDATTLHKILYWPPKPGEDTRFTRLREAPARLIIVDEASMMSPTVYADLQKWARFGVRVLLVGDDYQLPPVITGEELRQHGEDYSVFHHVGGPRLSTVMRSVGGVLRAATEIRERGDIVELSDFDGVEGYEFVRSSYPVAEAVESYLSERDDHILVTWKNSVRMQANRAIREHLGYQGELPDPGEPVLIKKNGQGLLNGEVVQCGEFEAGPVVGSMETMWMSVVNGPRILVSAQGGRDGEFFDGGAPWVQDWKRYHIDLNKQSLPEPIPVTFGYVLTAHSAQGSEARRVTVFLQRADIKNPHFRKMTTLPSGERVSMAARWAYTAVTRSKRRTTMLVGR